MGDSTSGEMLGFCQTSLAVHWEVSKPRVDKHTDICQMDSEGLINTVEYNGFTNFDVCSNKTQ